MRRLIDMMPGRLSRLVATLGLAAYLIGSLISIAAQSPDAFQRFGSLGVAAAILFFTDRLLQIELRRQAAMERILHEFGLELEVMKEGVAPKDIPNQGYVTDYLDEELQLATLRDHAERVNSRNIFLLTIATTQWGFGDVFLRWAFQ
jgi:hypothetical protein